MEAADKTHNQQSKGSKDIFLYNQYLMNFNLCLLNSIHSFNNRYCRIYYLIIKMSCSMIYILCMVSLFGITQTLIFPPPIKQQLSKDQFLVVSDPCLITLLSQQNIQTEYYFNKIIERLGDGKDCSMKKSLIKSGIINLIVEKDNSIKAQGYKLEITEAEIIIKFSTYSGYIYGLQSLYQLVSKDMRIPLGIVEDAPLVEHRGILVDTSRHFIKIQTIKRLIATMPMVKLNILHLHMNDNEAFSFGSNSHPQIPKATSQSPAFLYSPEQIKELIQLGKINGVNLIGQIATPGDTKSWSQSEIWKNKNITIACNKYQHQLDITMSQSLSLTKDLIRQIDVLFKDSPYIHLGGDSVNAQCWDIRKQQINRFKLIHNIKTLEELYVFWRYEIKQALPPARKTIFYQDSEPVKTSADDIIQYTGRQNQTFNKLKNSTSKLILSPYDILSISSGQGNISSIYQAKSPFIHGLKIYDQLIIFPEGIDKSKILGLQISVWTPITNDDTFENVVWMRGAFFASRVWSAQIMKTAAIISDIVKIQNSFYRLGINASPITSEFCQIYTDKCFPQKIQREILLQS